MFIITATADWWKGVSRTVKLVSYVGVVSGAIVASAQAWPILEPYWYAHRGYVRQYDDAHANAIIKRLIQVQLDRDNDQRQRLLDEAAKREIELQSDQAKQLPQYRDLVQSRVDRIKSELNTLDEQDKSLFREQKAIK